MKEQKNNKFVFNGRLVSEPIKTHTIFGEGFYEAQVAVKRLSGTEDVFFITIPEQLILGQNFHVGDELNAVGQLRTYNKIEDGRSRLCVTGFVQEICETDKDVNKVVLNGYICKPPIYRTTPFAREVADIILAVNRGNQKSDYIPCIAWGRNARFVQMLSVGDRLAVSGRFQSRQYQKTIGDEVVTKTAYEVSISKMATLDQDDEFDIERDFFEG